MMHHECQNICLCMVHNATLHHRGLGRKIFPPEGVGGGGRGWVPDLRPESPRTKNLRPKVGPPQAGNFDDFKLKNGLKIAFLKVFKV